MLTFVKKELRSATDVLISRLVKKAELVDAGILHAMMEDGMLKTTNPNNRSQAATAAAMSPPDQSSEFVPSNGNRSSAPASSFADSQDPEPNKRYSQPSAPQQGLGFAVTGNIHLDPMQSPTESQFSHSQSEGQQPSSQRTSYQNVSVEGPTTHHELPAEPEARSNDRMSDRYCGSESNAQAT